MLPVDRQPNTHASTLATVRGARRIVRAIRRHHLEEPLSWLAWLLSVALFAIWTLVRYHAPAEPAWVGMTIHASVVAAWLLVLREWLAIRWTDTRGRPSGEQAEQRGAS